MILLLNPQTAPEIYHRTSMQRSKESLNKTEPASQKLDAIEPNEEGNSFHRSF